MSSLTRLNILPSSLILSSSPLKNMEVYVENNKEYIPLLTSCQRSLENSESDLKDEKEDTTSVRIGACRTVCKTASEFLKELKIDKNVKFNWDVRSDIVINGILTKVEHKRRWPKQMSTNAVKVHSIFGSESKKFLKIPKIIDDYNHNMNEQKEFHYKLVWNFVDLTNDITEVQLRAVDTLFTANLLDPPVSLTTNVDSLISKEITPSQKHDLLFNINHLLELSVQEFNNDWWSLISNVWTVNLVLEKKEFQVTNDEKQKFVRLTYSPNYTHSLEESDKIKRLQIIRNLVEQEALKNYRTPAILNAVKEYVAERMDMDACVKELRCKEIINIKYKVHGALDVHLIGNTNHKLNIQESLLFLENQKYLVEHVDAHFFVSNKDSDTIVEALKTIRRFASNIEANSIKMAFPEFKNGEQECDTIFCTVHLVRTWMTKIYEHSPLLLQVISTNSLESYHSELKRTTSLQHDLIDVYLGARQHSPLLLQVISTNSLESYHSELKRTTSLQHDLIDVYLGGVCHKVIELNQKKRADSEYITFEFPCAVEKRIEKSKAAPKLTSLSCNCLFHRQYLLPYRHIFHEHMYGFTKLLITDAWAKFQFMFEENGFDVYTLGMVGAVDRDLPSK
ncbi:hypothetical protein Glove_334g17 [Diversispora epigaea]|uniref:MULE transposase domain-containing protein n=1 Tax=Diversispora epigaea TaxID=1348612 RepID=A0A397HIA1_9GLOM|nr:hypothetical protein Glove_334g17 [Diversispora epigaea]